MTQLSQQLTQGSLSPEPFHSLLPSSAPSRACVLSLWLYLFYNILSLSEAVALCLAPVTCHQVLSDCACSLGACGLPIAQNHMSPMAGARLSE